MFDDGLLDQGVAEAHDEVVSRVPRVAGVHEAEAGPGMQTCDTTTNLDIQAFHGITLVDLAGAQFGFILMRCAEAVVDKGGILTRSFVRHYQAATKT